MKIYVASSWSNEYQPGVVEALRADHHEVYDFRHPTTGDDGFHWSQIGLTGQPVPADLMVQALGRSKAVEGFRKDFGALQWADACVLVLPCGRSAHLEAGWFVGSGKPLYILWLENEKPDLMVKMATRIVGSIGELLDALWPGSSVVARQSEEPAGFCRGCGGPREASAPFVYCLKCQAHDDALEARGIT